MLKICLSLLAYTNFLLCNLQIIAISDNIFTYLTYILLEFAFNLLEIILKLEFAKFGLSDELSDEFQPLKYA